MRNLRLEICYDGTRYRGWQRLPNREDTIQGKLETALSRILGEPIEVTGSGRTDAGVHARGQVANFHCESAMPSGEILANLRRYLPEDIGIYSCKEVSPRFHARLNAREKTYCYRIWNSEGPCVFARRFVAVMPEKLDLENLLYRPLLLKWLPGVFGKISALFGENKLTAPLAKITLRISGILGRVFCDLPDALVLLLAKTVYRPTPESSDDKVYASMAYRLGKDIDILAIHQGKEQQGGRHYAHLVYRSLETIRKTTARITGNLSFALLMLCAAICVVFIYMILLHN